MSVCEKIREAVRTPLSHLTNNLGVSKDVVYFGVTVPVSETGNRLISRTYAQIIRQLPTLSEE